MILDEGMGCEYKIVTPVTQPYARFPATRAAEKAWWADYYKRNPTLLMRISKAILGSKGKVRTC
ncbi:MAG: hypothetical protein RR576_08340 [Oscillospiraceae bacterium]